MGMSYVRDIFWNFIHIILTKKKKNVTSEHLIKKAFTRTGILLHYIYKITLTVLLLVACLNITGVSLPFMTFLCITSTKDMRTKYYYRVVCTNKLSWKKNIPDTQETSMRVNVRKKNDLEAKKKKYLHIYLSSHTKKKNYHIINYIYFVNFQ